MTTAPVATAPARPKVAAPLLAVGLSFVLANLDATVVNVATSDIGQQLHAGISQLGWVVNGYILTFAAFLLIAGDLAARFGARRIYVIGAIVFTLASVASGLTPTIEVLIAARVIQGIGAAMFQPASLILLSAVFTEPAVRTRMIGLWAAMGASAAGLGPVIGGVLVSWLGWRSIFWVNLPVGILTIVLAMRALPRAVITPDKPIKLVGHTLMMILLAGVAIALMEGPAQGWGSGWVIGSATAAVIALVLLTIWQLSTDHPVYPPRLFRNRPFTLANGVGTLMNMGLFGGAFVLSLLLQQAKGDTPLQAGLQLLPMMLVFVIGNVAFSRAAGKLGTKLPIVLGMTAALVATAVFAVLLGPDLPYWVLAVLVSIANLGLGIASPAMTATMMSATEPRDTGTAGAMLNVNRQFGSLIGIAIMTGVVTQLQDWYSSARLSFAIAAIAYAGALVCGLLLKSRNRTDQGAQS